MNYYVYKITDTATGQFYFGSRKCKCSPMDDNYMGSMKTWKPEDKNRLIKQIIKDDFDSREDAIKYEANLIEENIDNTLNENYHIPPDRFYGGMLGRKHNDDTKSIISRKNKIYLQRNKKILDERVRNLQDWWNSASGADIKARNEKVSVALSGRQKSIDEKKKISSGVRNWHNDMSIKAKNEIYKKISKSNSKAVIHIESNTKFDSISEAADFFGLTRQGVSYHCRMKADKQKFKFIK